MLKLKEDLKNYVSNGGTVINEGFVEAMARIEEEEGASYEYTGDDAEIVKKIKELIETYVKPAVEMDGGNIEFKSFAAIPLPVSSTSNRSGMRDWASGVWVASSCF